ncbi:hypothetical protein MCNF_52660 [Mycolicibacterium confluentis]|uniref:Uncharacterized protein n=1 Tax=Mycolicibacterium confluentis TaxID=28047 RepID=A0A7I7Y712_9MYCO|nr:hypothetical protein [Mycolicibacterium confluentis]BBZ36661.1 hypothetical protein MCNF_52660 [Mycolicibacterium confluentis]
MGARCRACDADEAHCHGTLIVHGAGRPECTEDGCGTPELTMHTFVVDCDVVACECGQPIGSGARFASSTGLASSSG